MEYVMVTFPTIRNVYINGAKNGKTNEVLRVSAGTSIFDLGPLKNYVPARRKVNVSGTSVLDYKKIAFSKKETVG